MALRECFILGSGFSKAIHPALPTLKDLSEEVWKGLETYMNGPVERVNTEPFEKNVEFLLSYLTGNYPWLKQEEVLQNRRDFREVVKKIVSVIKAKRDKAFHPEFRDDDLPDWVEKLFTYWYQNESKVITLNYDTCLERIFCRFSSEWLDGSGVGHAKDLYPIPLRSPDDTTVSHSHRTDVKKFDLYKLHGSTNWFYSGREGYPGERIYCPRTQKLTESQREKRQKNMIPDLEPLIIPPVTDKRSFYENTSLRKMWNKASGPLNNAQMVYFLGYSFPETDMTLRFFFTHFDVVKDPTIKPTYVVNKPEVTSRYEKFLDSKRFEVRDYYTAKIENTTNGEGPIPKFVDDLVDGNIAG